MSSNPICASCAALVALLLLLSLRTASSSRRFVINTNGEVVADAPGEESTDSDDTTNEEDHSDLSLDAMIEGAFGGSADGREDVCTEHVRKSCAGTIGPSWCSAYVGCPGVGWSMSADEDVFSTERTPQDEPPAEDISTLTPPEEAHVAKVSQETPTDEEAHATHLKQVADFALKKVEWAHKDERRRSQIYANRESLTTKWDGLLGVFFRDYLARFPEDEMNDILNGYGGPHTVRRKLEERLLAMLFAPENAMTPPEQGSQPRPQLAGESPAEAFVLWIQLGTVWRGVGNVAKAIQCFRNAISLQPHSTTAALNLAVTLQGSGYVHDALKIVEDTIQREPNSTAPLFARANLFNILGRRHSAIEAYNLVLSLDPNFAPARDNLYRIEDTSWLLNTLNTRVLGGTTVLDHAMLLGALLVTTCWVLQAEDELSLNGLYRLLLFWRTTQTLIDLVLGRSVPGRPLSAGRKDPGFKHSRRKGSAGHR